MSVLASDWLDGGLLPCQVDIFCTPYILRTLEDRHPQLYGVLHSVCGHWTLDTAQETLRKDLDKNGLQSGPVLIFLSIYLSRWSRSQKTAQSNPCQSLIIPATLPYVPYFTEYTYFSLPYLHFSWDNISLETHPKEKKIKHPQLSDHRCLNLLFSLVSPRNSLFYRNSTAIGQLGRRFDR